ncbi:MAG: hypothetical protein U0325_06760 [Polyangiales bacterium]
MTPRTTTVDDRVGWAALVLGSAPGALLVLATLGGVVPERVALLAFAPSFVVLNLMHMAAAWARAYLGDPRTRARRAELVVFPAAAGLVALGAEALGGAVLVLGVQYYLSIHHAVMQNYGVLRASQRGSGRALSPASARLDLLACTLPVLAALVARARRVHVYNHAPLATPPAGLSTALAVAAAAALVALGVRAWRASRRGEALDHTGLGLVYGTGLLWSALLVGVRHPALPIYALASGHYVQHLWFVRRAEQGTPAALAALPDAWRRLASPDRALGYLAFLGALGAGVTVALSLAAVGLRALAASAGLRHDDGLSLPPWGAAMLAINLHHYALEHRLWRAPTATGAAPAPRSDAPTPGSSPPPRFA